MSSDLNQEVKTILSKLIGLELSEIKDESDIFNDLGIDSLKVIDIVTQIERTYKVKVKDSQLINLRTVKDVVNILRESLENK